MKIGNLLLIGFLFLSSFAATGVAPTKSELAAMYEKAFREFDANHYAGALKILDAIDARQPDLAESLNLRGVILMRQGEYDKAEAALRKALQIEPKFWNASFNLAEIPFLRKNWAESRNRFEALMAGNSGEIQGQTNLLIQYKIFLTLVLQGREKTTDWVLEKFEQSKDSPALYYSNAAVAFQKNNQKEANEWLEAARKQFSPQLNKLFAESFYEIGWLQKPAGEARTAIEITSTTERAERLKADAQANFEKAERAFQKRDFDGALKLLDLADEGLPNQAASLNLRGEILMEEQKLDEAEAAFNKAIAIDPKFSEAQYNLAQLPFKKKDYAKAREKFEALLALTPNDEKNQAAQLIKYKIFLALLLEGKEAPAQKMMDEFKFTGDTPALYYAQAAWAFKHGNSDQGHDWIVSAKKIYSPALNLVFGDSFYDLGWLTHPTEAAPPTAALAQANTSPPAATPAMRMGQAETLPAPVATEGAGAEVAQASVAPATGSPAENQPAPSATAAPSVAAAASPVSTPAVVAKQTESTPAKVETPKPAATPVARATAAAIAATKPSPAPVASAPVAASTREETPPAFGGASTRSLLVAALLLAGILLLVWLIVQQVRRHAPSIGIYRSSVPLTEPPFAGDEVAPAGDGTKVSRSDLAGGPPQVSLQLKASEPLVRKAVIPSAAIVGRGAKVESEEPAKISPNEPAVAAPAPAPPPVAPVPAPVPAPAPAYAAPEFVAKPPPFSEPVVAKKEEAVMAKEEAVVAKQEPVAAEKPPAPKPAFPSPPPAREIVVTELMPPEPRPAPARTTFAPIEVQTAIAGKEAVHSPVETPSFVSKIITTKPTTSQPTIPAIMPEQTLTPSPAVRPPSSAPAVAVQQPSGGMHTAVQLTFSLEIASMQLTPSFKMSGLQLKPTSKVVTMRLAPSQHPQPPMNLQVTFEVARIEVNNGTITSVRLTPSGEQKPAVLSSSSFPVTGLELVPAGSGSVTITPSHQEQASVHLTAAFQIAAIEFSPLFEIVGIVLNSTSKNVSMQLPGAGPSSVDGAPIFELANVELGGNNELTAIQVHPVGAGRRV